MVHFKSKVQISDTTSLGINVNAVRSPWWSPLDEHAKLYGHSAHCRSHAGAVHCIAHLLTCDSLDDLLFRLLCNLVGANRQSPVGPDEMAGVAVGISLEIILMLGFSLPEVACRNDFRNDFARPQA